MQTLGSRFGSKSADGLHMFIPQVTLSLISLSLLLTRVPWGSLALLKVGPLPLCGNRTWVE